MYSNFNCKEGHIGALCESCDLNGLYTENNLKYSATSPYNCGKCDE